MVSCYHCVKTALFGRRHTHHRGVAGGRWKKRAPKTQRIFKPNLQKVDIVENGKVKRVKICGKCLKRIKKDISEGVRPFLQLAQYQKDFSKKSDSYAKEKKGKENKEKTD